MRTQTLISVVFFLLIVGILAAILTGVWQGYITISSRLRYRVVAFYLAQAGVERAKIRVLKNVNFSGDSGWYTDLDDHPNDDVTFRYKFLVRKIGSNQREIKGIGEVLSANSNILARRKIVLVVEGVKDLQPPYGEDDDFKANVVNGSWREE